MLRATVRPLENATACALCVALFVLAACAPDPRRPRGGFDGSTPDFGADVDAGPGFDAGPSFDAGPGRDGGGVDLGTTTDAGRDAGPPPIATCQQRCTLASDCSNGSPATDANNYACTRGVCEYLGCRNDEECVATFGAAGGDWRCVTPAGGGLPSCSEVCASPTDCASPSPAVDDNNYACEAGVCRYLGCLNEPECMATFGVAGGEWVCRATIPGAPPGCVEVCRSPADCASAAPSVDADNYACEAGICRYLGCLDDAECMATFGTGGREWLCR
jgi:hypothetical protein